MEVMKKDLDEIASHCLVDWLKEMMNVMKRKMMEMLTFEFVLASVPKLKNDFV